MTRTTMRAKHWAALTAATAVLACEGPPTTAPEAPRSSYAISDGAHSGGNAHFHFLPPMVPSPVTIGAFDATLEPVVEICAWTGSECVLIARFTTTSGPGGETVSVSSAGHYVVSWQTDQFALDPDVTYRIRVLVGGVELGFADVDVADNGSDLKNVDTNEFIPLNAGRTLPIKFRIEEGAVVPLAVDDSYSTAASVAIAVAAPGVLANDADPDGDALTAALVGPAPTHGTVTFESDGSFVYTPNTGFSGSDSFQYVATDGTFDSNVGTVTITVTGGPPVAVDDSYGTARNIAIAVAAPGTLANDTDPDGDALTAAAVGAVPTHGTVSFNPDGSFVYTPSPGFSGSDSFEYVANDGTSDSNVATVTITVNEGDAPIAVDDAYETDASVAIAVGAPGILGNDTDPDGDALTPVAAGAVPMHGTVSVNSDGSFVYTPNPGFVGSDTFGYVANDGTFDSNVATVTITVVGGAPVAIDDAYTTAANMPLVVAAPGVLANDTDPNGDALTTVAAGAVPTHGTLFFNADGSFIYLPNFGFTGSDSFEYVANDGTFDSNLARVIITVN